MTASTEAAVSAAVAALADALLAAVRAERAAPAPDRLLSIDEAAATLGISRTTLYAELDGGRLRSCHVGRRRLIPAAAIVEYLGGRSTP